MEGERRESRERKGKGRERGTREAIGGKRAAGTAAGGGKASDCIRCGRCEQICPRHLLIRSILEEVAKTFEG